MKKLTFALASFLLAVGAIASTDNNEELAKRIAPVGQIYVAGQQAEVAAESSGPRSGEDVYKGACIACHGTGALDAPKPGADTWKPRIAQGFDVMLKHSIEGFNNMPAMGTCATCSEDEIAAAIRFMIDGV
ncbi:Cytochrome c5 [Arsukibacterium tuosuense]|uniref:Cytochrome c5 n=1 Tax=Arsukibacterium tuosuense TaxID=1323745 RepID=A0A285IMR5_9GAMM|nr:c-type cytochrome [Arsukibacterium tuosuense]SNY49279.1 Cytochrome c5 [Arsukibacterium tuosuense]